MQLLPSKNEAQVMFPELAQEAHADGPLVEVDDEFDAEGFPEAEQRDVSLYRYQPNIGVEIEDLSLGHEGVERIRIEMVAVGRVGRPVGVGVMRRDQPDSA